MGFFLCEEARIDDLKDSIITRFEGERVALLGEMSEAREGFASALAKNVLVDVNPEVLGLKHRAFVVFYREGLTIDRVYSVPCTYIFDSLLDFVRCEIDFNKDVNFVIDNKSIIKKIYREIESIFSFVTMHISVCENVLYNCEIFNAGNKEDAENLLGAIKEFLCVIEEGKISAVNICGLVNVCKKFVKFKNKISLLNEYNLALNCAKNYESFLGQKLNFLSVYLQNVFAKINEKFLSLKNFSSAFPVSFLSKKNIAKNLHDNNWFMKDFLSFCDNKNLSKILTEKKEILMQTNSNVLEVSNLALKSYDKITSGFCNNVYSLDLNLLKISMIKGIEESGKTLSKIMYNLGYFGDFV